MKKEGEDIIFVKSFFYNDSSVLVNQIPPPLWERLRKGFLTMMTLASISTCGSLLKEYGN